MDGTLKRRGSGERGKVDGGRGEEGEGGRSVCERAHQKSHRKRQRQSSKKGQRGTCREGRDAKRYKEVRVLDDYITNGK